MRLTRAALRAGAHDLDDETTDASQQHTDAQERVPLGEVTANAANDPESNDIPTKKMAVKKGRSSKKGAKGKKTKAAHEEEEEAEGVVEEAEPHDAGAPTDDSARHDLADEPTASACQHRPSLLLPCAANCGEQIRSKLP